MDANASENAAFTMLHEASVGKDISNRYNALTLPEQRQVLDSMRAVQSGMMAQFGNIELYDGDQDGILDDARARVVDKSNNVLTKDVYNPTGARPQTQGENSRVDKSPTGNARQNDAGADKLGGTSSESTAALPTQQDINRDPFMRQADNLMRTAARGGDIYRQYSRLDQQTAADMLKAMEIVQAAKPQEYGNVKLVDADKNGILDDVQVVAMTNRGPREVDAFKTPADINTERTQKTVNDGLGRAGEIVVQEGINGILRGGRGPSFGDRVQRRMGNEAVRGTNRILRDVLGSGR
ncbi:MAG: hypothetical protein K2Y39_11965 [Candidatus Obscuribacterales bacterium]|nr:hypothetical protein [Candidatus Obscuribacterales bacterium]